MEWAAAGLIRERITHAVPLAYAQVKLRPDGRVSRYP